MQERVQATTSRIWNKKAKPAQNLLYVSGLPSARPHISPVTGKHGKSTFVGGSKVYGRKRSELTFRAGLSSKTRAQQPDSSEQPAEARLSTFVDNTSHVLPGNWRGDTLRTERHER
jgi:hypothetical protein